MSDFWTAYRETLREIATTRALWSTMLVAVLFYAFYYPAPYRHQGVVDLPVVVVDEENSALTRRLIADLDGTREIAVIAEVPSEAAAMALVRDREADGMLTLSRGLTERLVDGKGVGGVHLVVNGAYLLRARALGVALERVVGGEIELAGERLVVRARPPVVTRALFNPTEGYADYIFPAVSVVILQQTLLFGAAMLAARRRERNAPADNPWGRLAALASIGSVATFFYFGPVFWALDMPRGGNVPALLLAVPLFAWCVAALGTSIGAVLDEGDRAMELLVPTSLLVFFLSGAAWPTQMMPLWVESLAALSPASHGVPLFVGLNQMGASLVELWKPLLGLSVLSLVATALAYRALRASPAR